MVGGGGQINLSEHISSIITISNAINFGINVSKASLTSYAIRILSKFPMFGLLGFHLGKFRKEVKTSFSRKCANMPKIGKFYRNKNSHISANQYPFSLFFFSGNMRKIENVNSQKTGMQKMFLIKEKLHLR